MPTVTLGKEGEGSQDLRSASNRSRRMFNRKVSTTAKKEVPPEEVTCCSRGFSHSLRGRKLYLAFWWPYATDGPLFPGWEILLTQLP